MNISLRSALTVGVTAITTSALVMAPSVTAPQPRHEVVSAPVHLAAAVQQLRPNNDVAQLSQNDLQTVGAAMKEIIARADVVGASPTSAPANAVVASPTAAPAPQNAVSNVIDAVYGVSRYWANYVSLDLGPWLINWIPFGYLISDQIYIWYPTFVLPVVDSFVYDFLDPVVNAPLNLGVWLDGLGAMTTAAFDGVVSGISQEINYVFSLGWLPFPVPPLPPFPSSATVLTVEAPGETIGDTLAATRMAATDIAATDPETADTAATDIAATDPETAEVAATDPGTLEPTVDPAVVADTAVPADAETDATPVSDAAGSVAVDGPDGQATAEQTTTDNSAVADVTPEADTKTVTKATVTKATADITKAAESSVPAKTVKSAGDAPDKADKGLSKRAAKKAAKSAQKASKKAAKDARKADKKAPSED